MSDFKPVLFMKRNCPFCLKLASFLAEAGIWNRFEIRGFYDGEEEEASIRATLAPHFEKVTFPALEYAPGQFMAESDDIIAKYAKELDLTPSQMSYYQYVLAGPVRRMGESFRRIRDLENQLGETSA